MKSLFRFPDPVNDLAARTVAAGVVVLSVAFVFTRFAPILIVLAAGFVARLATGPTLSPLGQLATRVVAPRLGAPRLVPGPPKRFAQGIGTAFSLAGVIAWFGMDAPGVAVGIIAALAVPAFVEAAFGFCVGCALFGVLIRARIIPESVCPECADLRSRYPERYAA